ncbi:hypothetical protein MMC09_006627 [Bachmanniomyces sp. S44760]|nr:hypothetical protein [Bachmanniomyces sp. S44760]
MPSSINTSAIYNVFKVIRDPALCLPHGIVSSFDQLPLPISRAFLPRYTNSKCDIKAVVLDKDNCFAIPKTDEVYAPYQETFEALRKAYPGSRLLIVSNSAGTNDDSGDQARRLEQNTGVKVLEHSTKKPGCGPDIMNHFFNAADSGVTKPSQVAIIGDRLFTDMLMANMMGSWSVWVRDGVVKDEGLFARIEKRLAFQLTRRGFEPQVPSSQFEG